MAHSHTVGQYTEYNVNVTGSTSPRVTLTGTTNTGSTGTGVNNMNPYKITRYIVKT